jgi:hypothetical protein
VKYTTRTGRLPPAGELLAQSSHGWVIDALFGIQHTKLLMNCVDAVDDVTNL